MSPIVELRRLAADPNAQAAYALSLLRPDQPRQVLQAALAVLAETPTPAVRLELLALYAHLAADSRKRDAGAFLRRAVVDALRPVALPADVTLALDAVAAYQFMPDDQAQTLRASGLLLLNDLDETLARFHAVRLLADPHTSLMSGEPALTAVQVLASQDELAPLYLFALQSTGQGPLAPVAAECLRSLVALPAPLVGSLVEHFHDAAAVAQIGLIDLLVNHRAGPQALDYVAGVLAKPSDLDLYRYLNIALLSSHKPELRALVLHAARAEVDRQRRAILREALAPFAGEQEIAEIVSKLRPLPYLRRI